MNDLYLTEDPTITFFKMVYRRPLNFSIYEMTKPVKAQSSFGTNFKIELDKNGDLLHQVYLVVDIPNVIVKSKIPTYRNVIKILDDYGITMTVADSDLDKIVTLDNYNKQIIEIINAEIRRNVDFYNFFVNANILSSNSYHIKALSTHAMTRSLNSVTDYIFNFKSGNESYGQWGNTIKNKILEIKNNKVLNGIYGSLILSKYMLTVYAQEYSNTSSIGYIPNVANGKSSLVMIDSYGKKKTNILIYSNDFRNGFEINTKNILLNTGILCGLLENFYYDTMSLNLNPNSNPLNHGFIKFSRNNVVTTNSLFGELLNAPPNTLKNDIVDFRLYNSDDMQYIYHIIIMFNLTSLKPIKSKSNSGFYMDHAEINLDLLLPPMNNQDLYGLFDPYISKIDDNIIFYYILDPNIQKYNVSQAQVGQKLSDYMYTLIESFYTKLNGYNANFPFVNLISYVQLDSFLILKHFINELIVNGSSDIVVNGSVQLQGLAKTILYNFQYNMQYNLALIRNIINTVYNSTFQNTSHFRFTHYKTYSQTLPYPEINQWTTSTINSTFANNSDSSIVNSGQIAALSDNFETNIRSNNSNIDSDGNYILTINGILGTSTIPIVTPNGTKVTNYFSNIIKTTISNLRTSFATDLNTFEKLGYMVDFRLWTRNLMSTGNQIHSTYNLCLQNNLSIPPFDSSLSLSLGISNMSVMNFLPLLAARDIPVFVYNMFRNNTYISTNIGDTLTFNMANAMNLRDTGDSGAPALDAKGTTTKNQIYQTIINAIIGTTTVVDKEHYNQLYQVYTAGTFALTNTFRPETFFKQYSIEDTNGGLIEPSTSYDALYDTNNLTYLPLEWLTQTYYHILADRLTTYYNAHVTSTVIKLSDLLLLLKTVINCFIVHTDCASTSYPSYTKYKNNGYTLIGLVPETSLAPSNYTTNQLSYQFPTYSDCITSLWYQLLKKNINYFNSMFNNTLVSSSYYANNLGSVASDVFNFIVQTINGDRCIEYYDEQTTSNNIKSAVINNIGTISNTDLQNYNSISVIINASSYNGNAPVSSENRVVLNFDDGTREVLCVLKNHVIDYQVNKIVNYNEKYTIPPNLQNYNCSVEYINNTGYQIYNNVLVFLNNKNFYYDSLNVYVDKILTTYLDNSGTNVTSEPFSPMASSTVGFDFYRIQNLNNVNKYTGKSKYLDITNYINDNVTLFNYNLSYYNSGSNILNLVNDSNFVQPDLSIKNKKDYYFEETDKICYYLNNDINERYINPLPLNDYSNIVTTTSDGNHQIANVIQPISQYRIPIVNTDIIGFAVAITDNIQNDWSIGFGIGYYPYTKKKALITKTGNVFNFVSTNPYLPGTTTHTLTLNPTSTTIYYFILNLQTHTLYIYEGTNNVLTLNSDTVINSFVTDIGTTGENFIFYNSGKISVQYYTINEALTGNDATTSVPLNVLLTSTTYWFCSGIPLNKYQNTVLQYTQRQIIFTSYYDGSNLNLNKTNNTVSFLVNDIHPFGNSFMIQPKTSYNSNTNIIGFCFMVLANSTNLGVGFYNNVSNVGGSVIIQKTQIKLQYNATIVTIALNTTLNFDTTSMYYVFFNYTTNILTLYQIVSGSVTYTNSFNIAGGSGISNLNGFFTNNFNFYVSAQSYIRYFTDRYAYNNASTAVKTVMTTTDKWYSGGGIYTIPYISAISQLQNVKFLTKIQNFGTNFDMQNISAKGYDFTDIVFPGNSNILSYSYLESTEMFSNDTIGFAFSVIDNSNVSFGIGLGTDGFYSNKRLQMNKNNGVYNISMTSDGTTINTYNYIGNQVPIYDSTEIFYCFQNNTAGTFKIYSSQSINPIFDTSDASFPISDPTYTALVNIFKNNANLCITGKTSVKFYTAKYAYTQTISSTQNLIKGVTKWLYTGGNDITPFVSSSNEQNSLIQINYLNQQQYFDNNIYKNTDNKNLYTVLLSNINTSLNPNGNYAAYNLNGIHGKFTDDNNEQWNIDHNTQIYGVLDAIYNTHLTGNISSTMKLMNMGIPQGLILTSPVTNDVNPFYSFSLYDNFLNITSASNSYGYTPISNKIPIPSKTLVYSDLPIISNMFDNLIGVDGVTNVALENVLYENQPSCMYLSYNLIPTATLFSKITTTDIHDHIFLTTNDLMTGGKSVLLTSSYASSFIITQGSILSNNLEFGFALSLDRHNIVINKIAIRQIGNTNYVYLVYSSGGTIYKKIENFSIQPNLNNGNIYTIFVFNNSYVGTGTSGFQIYENNNLILQKTYLNTDIFYNLFVAGSYNIYINGEATISILSKTYLKSKANSVIRALISNVNNIWFSTIDTPAFTYFTNYSYITANFSTTNYTSITTTQTLQIDYLCIPAINLTLNDVYGIAFEIPDNTITNMSIGFNYNNTNSLIPNSIYLNRTNSTYTININSSQTTLSNVSFTRGNIYMMIINNSQGTLNIYKITTSSVTTLIYSNSILIDSNLESLLSSTYSVTTNILISTNVQTSVNFYTLKYMYGLTNIATKLIMTTINKWLYIGALDTTPISKIAINPSTLTHNVLSTGITLSAGLYSPALLNPPTSNLPVSVNPPTAVLSSTIQSLYFDFTNKNYSEFILNDSLNSGVITIKPAGLGIIKYFDPITQAVEYANYILALKTIYVISFTIPNNSATSNFCIGFYSWLYTNITFQKIGTNYSIVINYLNFNYDAFNPSNRIAEYSKQTIPITTTVSIDPNALFTIIQNNNLNTFSVYQNNNLIIEINNTNANYLKLLNQIVPPLNVNLKTMAGICLGGTANIKMRIYSKNYTEKINKVSLRNIINASTNDIVWFGMSTSEDENVNNTSDYCLLCANNNSMHVKPTLSIGGGIMGFAFSISKYELSNYNDNGLRIGIADSNYLSSGIFSYSSSMTFSLIEMTIKNNYSTITINGVQKHFTKTPTLSSNNMYYMFQDNTSNCFRIYENDQLIYFVDSSDSDYNTLLTVNYNFINTNSNNRFRNPLYLFLCGKTTLKVYNAPYAYQKASSIVKILIDSSTAWISSGGSNTGAIKQRLISSSKMYNDVNVRNNFVDSTTGVLSNFSLIALYIYNILLKNSQLNSIFDFTTIYDNIAFTETDMATQYKQTISNMNTYALTEIQKYYNNITKITSLSTMYGASLETALKINGFNIFFDNIYKVTPYNGVSSSLFTGLFDYQLFYNIIVNLYYPSENGYAGGVIKTFLETDLLKMIGKIPKQYAWVKELGHKLIKNVSISIGDQIIDTHDSNLLHFIYNSECSIEHKSGYDMMIGNTENMYTFTQIKNIHKLFIPMQFWFCKDYGNSLPLCSLMHTNVMIDFEIEKIENLICMEDESYMYSPPKINYEILCEYVLLEEDERMRMAKLKLDYLIERYRYNGKNTISAKKYFMNPVTNYTESSQSLPTPNAVINNTLNNILYQTELSIPNNATIQPQRTDVIDYIEVITRDTKDYNMTPSFLYTSNSKVGFCFEILSKPETNIFSIEPFTVPAFSIGLTFGINTNINNNTTIFTMGTIRFTPTTIIIDNTHLNTTNNVTYIQNPKFTHGTNTYLYTCIQDYANNQLLLYENSTLIAQLTQSNQYYAKMLFYTLNSNSYLCNKLNLNINGQARVAYYNAKTPYIKGENSIQTILDSMTNWIYLGGDNSPLNEVYDIQKTINLQNFTNPSTNKYVSVNSVLVNTYDTIGFSFSITYQSKPYPNCAIGICGINNDVRIQMQIISGITTILVNDGTSQTTSAFIKTPIFFGQDPDNFQTVVYTCIQDNVTKTFTIYEEDYIIGQIDVSNLIYSNIIKNTSNYFIRVDTSININNVTFYTSNDMYENHTKYNLRTIINVATQWLSFENYNPNFYVKSYRNIEEITITDFDLNVSVANNANGYADITLIDDSVDYVIDTNQIFMERYVCGFGFSLPNTNDVYFTLGMISKTNSNNTINIIQDNTKIYFSITYTDANTKIKQTSIVNINKNINNEALYTIILDTNLCVLSLYENENIIGYITKNNNVFNNFLLELKYGFNIYSNVRTLRMYQSNYIYNKILNISNLINYLGRIDKWYFAMNAQNTITTKTQQSYTPTQISIRVNMNESIKYLIWTLRAYDKTTEILTDIINWNQNGYYVRDSNGNNTYNSNVIDKMGLKIFGVEREQYREENYFNNVVPWRKFFNSLGDGEYIYSFALFPTSMQPSGTCNYGEVDDSFIILNFTNEIETMMRENPNLAFEFNLWGKANNILRICSGMAGLVFDR
ncbi:capsid protein [Bodo saltans virus]|uniref:Capsid protein n=1 Tax=Bodo saltans virus TaxID=2024608 RepID=A0A2H4UUL3_9VIRU|nr:capsid protein [Bodo saltans virus]ATZ80556.1 capsid protein [Bodo saltans virus]